MSYNLVEIFLKLFRKFIKLILKYLNTHSLPNYAIENKNTITVIRVSPVYDFNFIIIHHN